MPAGRRVKSVLSFAPQRTPTHTALVPISFEPAHGVAIVAPVQESELVLRIAATVQFRRLGIILDSLRRVRSEPGCSSLTREGGAKFQLPRHSSMSGKPRRTHEVEIAEEQERVGRARRGGLSSNLDHFSPRFPQLVGREDDISSEGRSLELFLPSGSGGASSSFPSSLTRRGGSSARSA